MADYEDEALVYVDPKNKAVVGPVVWLPNGKVKAMEMKMEEEAFEETEESKTSASANLPAGKAGATADKKGKRKPRKPKKRYYPWCSYRTAKKMYHVEGKYKEEEKNQPLDTALKRALKEPFWD